MAKSMKSCGAPSYFLIATLLVFFMLLYVYAAKAYPSVGPSSNVEKFRSNQGANLLSPENIVVLQGSQVPDSMPATINWDTHASLPTVDGTNNAPRSLFMFAYNQCSPSCCNKGSPYSCSGGCVCMTDNQKNMIGTRGSNSASSRCTGQSEF